MLETVKSAVLPTREGDHLLARRLGFEKTPRCDLPLDTRFRLGAELSEEQRAFLAARGFLVFDRAASRVEVGMILSEADQLAEDWLRRGVERVHGIPLFKGRDPDGAPFIQRLAFCSLFSDKIRGFVHDPRFEPIRRVFGDDARVGDREKDGVVLNRYLNIPGGAFPKLGWHTDGLRDLFYGRMPGPMLNVGLHLDRIRAQDGGLRLIPGSHRQGFLSMCFAKPYFVYHRRDPKEITVETEAGDLTIHDGRLWHRVAQSEKRGWASLRRSMYVPYLNGPYEPKTEASPTPPYHQLGKALRALRRLRRREGRG